MSDWCVIAPITRYGEAGPGPKGSVMSATFELDGQEFFALNGGPYFTFSPAISFIVNCETQKEVDEFWEKLSAGGEKQRCGWLKERYGVSWHTGGILRDLPQDGRAPGRRLAQVHAIVRRIRPVYVMACGLIVSAIGFGIITQINGASSLAVLVIGSLVFSLGLTPVVTLTTDMVVGAAPPERAGAAASLSETASEFGGALGIAIFGSIGTAIYRSKVGSAISIVILIATAMVVLTILRRVQAGAH